MDLFIGSILSESEVRRKSDSNFRFSVHQQVTSLFFFFFCVSVLVCVCSKLSINAVLLWECESLLVFVWNFSVLCLWFLKISSAKIGLTHRGFGQRVPRLYIPDSKSDQQRNLYLWVLTYICNRRWNYGCVKAHVYLRTLPSKCSTVTSCSTHTFLNVPQRVSQYECKNQS